MNEKTSFGRDSVVARLEGKTMTTGGEPSAVGDFALAKEKYEIEAVIGAGGMGEVLLVQDRDLRRQVAMKVIKGEMAGVGGFRLKFVAEAQATSQLEHPGIPPVHDIGITPDGQVYFTMKLVRGRTLREILKDLLLGVKEARREYTLHRLATVLERVAEALHFAHEKGVIHRDLKPENVMLGPFGEVHVMDWGIARVVKRTGELDTEDRIVTAEEGVGSETEDGMLKGTLPYMSPEQAAGKSSTLDRRSDVYALGCLLYEALTLHRAFDGRGAEMFAKIRKGDYAAVETRNPRRPVPPALADLCRKAMAILPEDRPATARAFAEGLRSWMDGTSERERRHADAERLGEQGRARAARYGALKREIDQVEAEIEGFAGRYKPWQGVEEKAPLLAARKRLSSLRGEAGLELAEALRLLEGAVLEEEGHPGARAALAEIWRDRLEEAEARRDGEQVSLALTMIRRYDDGRYAKVVAGTGSLYLGVEPPGAQVALVTQEDRDGILVTKSERALGKAPVGPLELPMGSYLCVVRAPGFREVRYPVHVRRNRSWSGCATLLRDGEIGEEFVLVPGGPFLSGEGRTASLREVPDFAIQRCPVTFADWIGFLGALESEDGPEEAAKRIPGTAGDGPFVERAGAGGYRILPLVVTGKGRERCAREHGGDFDLRVPVIGVSFEDAAAYCGWKTRTTGREWRLPTEEEREKAARGVDGRRFPWGDLEDASLGKCRDSREEPAQPEPVGAFPASTSIYGMVDAAGGAWDWTDTWMDSARHLRVLKGGAWSSPLSNLRCSGRLGYEPTIRLAVTGFRCARSLGPPAAPG